MSGPRDVADVAGNSLLVEKLLAKSGADVHLNTQVTRIARVGNGEWRCILISSASSMRWLALTIARALAAGYSVTTVPASDGDTSASPKEEQEQIFDRVVLAAPIEFSSLQFVNITLPPITPRTYSHWCRLPVRSHDTTPLYLLQT